jgi:rifampin ADP-ribosylating transferase
VEPLSRVYLVEPTGEVEDDPNLTNSRFRGNPTKSFRSRAPLRVTGELTEWAGHPPETVRAMKEGLARQHLVLRPRELVEDAWSGRRRSLR